MNTSVVTLLEFFLFFFPRSPAIQLVGLLLSTFVDYIVFGNAMMNLASLGKYGRC